MSIKNDIEMVKEELSSEEKFFERSVITERFIKKYKGIMITSVVAIIILVGANIAYELNEEATSVAANETLLELQKDASNTEAISKLQTLSPTLYDAYLYSIALADKDLSSFKKLKSSESSIIADLADYESSKTIEELDAYSLKEDAIYKDLARIQSAILLLEKGNTNKAHEKLLLISDTSSFNATAKALLHYGVK